MNSTGEEGAIFSLSSPADDETQAEQTDSHCNCFNAAMHSPCHGVYRESASRGRKEEREEEKRKLVGEVKWAETHREERSRESL